MFKLLNRLLISSVAILSWSYVSAEELFLEEVIVTATKREGVAQDIPLALSVLPENFIESNAIRSIEDLRDFVPGLEVVSVQPSSNIIGMRGVVALGGPISPVGYYLDETPLSAFGSNAPAMALWDLQRVEVLRGPQGTLFGDGSMAGTIRAITNKPDTEAFSGRVWIDGYSYDGGNNGYNLRALLNMPVSDTLAFRISAGYKDDGGYITNVNFDDDGDNAYDETSVRAAMRWLPGENTVVDLSYTGYRLNMGNDNAQTSPGIYDPDNFFPPGFVIPAVERDVRKMDYDLFNLTIEHDFSNFSLVSATSYYDSSGSSFEDLNYVIAGFFFGGPVADFLPGSTAADVIPTDDQTTFTQEIRLVSNGDNRLDWTVGAFYKDLDRSIVSGFDLRVFLDLALEDPELAGIVIPIADELGLADQSSDAQSWAIFAELDYELTDTVSLTGGLRYYEDTRDSLITALTDSEIFGIPAGDLTPGSGDDNALSPKLGLSWKTSDTTTLFASASKGFRSGDANANHIMDPELIPVDYGAETLWTYEIGVKSNPTDKLLTNFYLYYNDWTDMQLLLVTENGLFSYTDNVGSATATGAELEVMYLVSNDLSLTLSASYIDAEIGETVISPDGVEVANEGNEIPFIAPFTANLGFDYSHPFGNNMSFVASGNYAYKDRTFSDAANAENQKNDSYDMLNARIGVQWENWGIYAYGRNLANTDATTLKTQPIGVLNDVIFSIYVPPRSFGLELQASF